MSHDDAYARFIFDRFQYAARASSDATPASGATAFRHADDPVFVLPFSIQIERDPQEDDSPNSKIYDIHFLLFCMIIYLYRQMSVENILGGVKNFHSARGRGKGVRVPRCE
jgi:hypothetical protein